MYGDEKLSSPGGAGSTDPSEWAISQWGGGFSTPCVAVSTRLRTTTFSSPMCWGCRCMQGFMSWDGTLSSPVGAITTHFHRAACHKLAYNKNGPIDSKSLGLVGSGRDFRMYDIPYPGVFLVLAWRENPLFTVGAIAAT